MATFSAHHRAVSPIGRGDKLSPHMPFIMVSVGYSKRESHAWPWLRIRDLTPPGEAVPDVIRQTVEPAVKAGRLSQDEGRRYLAMFANPAADTFLAFLEQELHPQLARTFRTDPNNVALWGYSYGGLFSTYVAIRRSDLFTCIGAGSPGIVAQDSRIFGLYRRAAASKQDYSGRRLHVTLGARELAQPSIYQWLIARGASELLAQNSTASIARAQDLQRDHPIGNASNRGGAGMVQLRPCLFQRPPMTRRRPVHSIQPRCQCRGPAPNSRPQRTMASPENMLSNNIIICCCAVSEVGLRVGSIRAPQEFPLDERQGGFHDTLVYRDCPII